MSNEINSSPIRNAAIDNGKYFSNPVKSAENAVAMEAESNSNDFATSMMFAGGSAALFEGIPLALYAKRNRTLKGAMTKDMVNLSNSTKAAAKNIYNGKGSVFDRISNYFRVINTNKEGYDTVRSIAKAKVNLAERKENLIKAKEALADTSRWTPKFIRKWLCERAENKVKNAEELIKKGVQPAALEGAKDSAGKLAKIGKVFKTTGVLPFLILGTALEAILEIYPTFKELGEEKGKKQIAKSMVHVAMDTAGFIAGQQAGMAIGSAIGTALFPGIGTAIGGITGFITGCIGSYAIGKVTEHLVGKSELEIAEEEQKQKMPNLNNLSDMLKQQNNANKLNIAA